MLEVSGHRVIVGVDESGSMDTRDCPNRATRRAYLAEKIATFVGEAVKSSFGGNVTLLFFSDTVEEVVVATALEATAALNRHRAGGDTYTHSAILAAWDLHQKAATTPTMVFLATDGVPNSGGTLLESEKRVDDAIIGITKKLDKPESFRVMILTVGVKTDDVTAWLKHLDADLGPSGAKFDIVGQNDLMEVDFQEAAAELIGSTTTDDEAAHGETQGKVTQPKTAQQA